MRFFPFLFLTAALCALVLYSLILLISEDENAVYKPESKFSRVFHGLTSERIRSPFGVYVREAYRVANDEIRIVYLQHRDDKRDLQVRLNNSWLPVDWFCFNRTCDDYLFCDLATRIGVVRENFTDTPNSIEIGLAENEEYFHLKLNDVRIRKGQLYNHMLGICLQPIFFYTDWPLIIQFFETWLAQGATKFYFYLHSYSPQVKEVLDFYKSVLGSNLELIPWSDLPVRNRDIGLYEADPNGHVFRHAATAFMHDCMLRARSNVKFIANFDVDDLPFAQSGRIDEVLNQLLDENPDAAQFIVDWRMAYQQNKWHVTRGPRDVIPTFQEMRLYADKAVREDYAASRKIFHVPERVIHFDMHSVYRNEPRGSLEFLPVTIAGDPRLFVLHMRQFQRLIRDEPPPVFNTTFDYRMFYNLNRMMLRNYQRRIKNTSFADKHLGSWVLEAHETMRNLEECRRRAFGTLLTAENRMCQQSSAGCAGMLMAGVEWIKTSLTWVDIAHSALFNQYTQNR